MPLHAKQFEEVLKIYDSNPIQGLLPVQVNELRGKYGANILVSQKPKSSWILFFEQFNNPVIYILIVAAILNAILADLKDTLVIGVAVFLNTIIGFIQEQRASDALKALRNMAAPTAKVIREGVHKSIPTTDVVCGDIIVLESGVRVPADARLVDSQNLLVDESMLTGESFSIMKKHDAIISESAPLGDRITMVYSGTIVQKGRGLAVVTAVGTKSEFGKISEKVAEAEETVSPLQIQMAQFSKLLSIAIMAIIAVIFFIGFLYGKNWLDMFLTSVALAVSAIPEGLPVAVTITLSIGLSQMAKRNAIVKKLSAVETLGSTNVICTDKTGTLTKNQMLVTEMYCGGESYEFSGSGYLREGNAISKNSRNVVFAKDNKTIELAAFIGAKCTESTITENGNEWEINGDPTEAALMIAALKLEYNSNNSTVFIDIPFESENQLMAVRVKTDDNDYVLVKGAPEKILRRCRNMLDNDGNTIQLNNDKLDSQITEFSKKGLRILALAYVEKKCDKPLTMNILKDLTFVGFAGIQDSVRPEVIEAVTECHKARVRVVMITGDHAKTAIAVAKTVGIGYEKEEPIAITGQEIDAISEDELLRRTPEIDVYARVAPHHKYKIVKNLQAHNNIVSMTGDGVNDAPALKQADIGVAMGSGSDVAKEAAHMVLTDDNFATIVKAVRRGRVILHNLQHIILYILATCTGGLLTIAVSVALGFPLPILPAQILWINLVTDGTSTFPLAFEKEHGNVMVFPPRKKNAPLITRRMLYRIIIAGVIMMFGTLAMFYLSVIHAGYDIYSLTSQGLNSEQMFVLRKSQTIAFCVLAFFQIWNVQNSRSVSRSLFWNLPLNISAAGGEKMEKISPLKNPILLGIMILAVVLQISAVEVPVMRDLLDTINLTIIEWLRILGITFSIIIIVEVLKLGFALFNKHKIKDEASFLHFVR